jgi:hypothetical protein
MEEEKRPKSDRTITYMRSQLGGSQLGERTLYVPEMSKNPNIFWKQSIVRIRIKVWQGMISIDFRAKK